MAYTAAPHEVAVARFWSRVDMSSGCDSCWPWTLSMGSKGYGQAWWYGRVRGTHVIAYLIYTSEEPALKVLHRCDNPPCCNPGHLFLGTHKDNMADMVRKGRQRNDLKASRGCNNGRAVLTERLVAEMRTLAATGTHHSVLARRFGVSDTHVRRVVRRESWR